MAIPRKVGPSRLFREQRNGLSLQLRLFGGGRGIRTPGTVSRTAVFKTACFNRSHIPPHEENVYFHDCTAAVNRSKAGSVAYSLHKTRSKACIAATASDPTALTYRFMVVETFA